MRIVYSLLIIWALFNGIFISKFNFPRIVGYWDELFTIFLLFYFLLRIGKRGRFKNLDNKKLLIKVSMIIIIGILGNIYYRYTNSMEAIIRDIVGFIKFPILYVALCESQINKMLYKQNYRLKRFYKAYSVILFLFGIFSIFVNTGMNQVEYRYGFHPFMFLYGHPTGLVIAIVILMVLMNTSEDRKEFTAYYIINILTLVLTFRTKGIAIAALFLFLKFSAGWSKKLRFIYWGGAAFVVILILWSKLSLYMSYTGSGRQSLYEGALTLARMCFPIGSGFGTYGSHVSGKFYSKVYDFIYIPEVNFFTSDFSRAILGDVGYPYYLGQFGVFGFLIMIKLLIDQLRISIGSKKSGRKMNLSMFILIAYCFIGLTAESTLLNFGAELAIALSITRLKESDEVRPVVSAIRR
ncbi:hypothetical protein [Butyrivibrio sp. FCS014]|uniref:hypothetical protein n=1 Tax=Butyrivibrio sp. FCS014 TaxID=1408304 RepID=UPI0004642FD4|nr:hypothetical protein [Butyrivibrio sp. FCS014]